MKKQLNTDAITNELTSASLFFKRREETPRDMPPAPQASPVTSGSVPKAAGERHPNRSSERPNERTTDRAHVAGNVRSSVRRRGVKRYSFEFYEDQIERVKRLALEDQLRGGTLNMSVIVRQALDRHLADLGKGE